jgi:hypothetical protein
MKYVSLVVVAFLLPLILSCRSTTAPSSETAHVIGRAELQENRYHPTSNSGIQVTVENTSFSAVTDDSGLFEFKNIPEGTYNIHFSKAGYGDVYWYGKPIQGGGNAPVYWTEYTGDYNSGTVALVRRSNLVTTLLTAIIVDTSVHPGYPLLKLTGSYVGSDTTSIAVFFSHDANVSRVPGTYESYVIPYYNPGGGIPTPSITFHSTANTFDVAIDARLFWGNFHSGDSVFITSYGSTLGYQGGNSTFEGDYFDAINRIWVLTSINQTPSPVIGIKIP